MRRETTSPITSATTEKNPKSALSLPVEETKKKEPLTFHSYTKDQICALYKKSAAPKFGGGIDEKIKGYYYSEESVTPVLLQDVIIIDNDDCLYKPDTYKWQTHFTNSKKTSPTIDVLDCDEEIFGVELNQHPLPSLPKNEDYEKQKAQSEIKQVKIASLNAGTKRVKEEIEQPRKSQKLTSEDLFKHDTAVKDIQAVDHRIIEAEIIKDAKSKRTKANEEVESITELIDHLTFEKNTGEDASNKNQIKGEAESVEKEESKTQSLNPIEVSEIESLNFFRSPLLHVRDLERVWCYSLKDGEYEGPYSSVEMHYLYKKGVINKKTEVKCRSFKYIVGDIIESLCHAMLRFGRVNELEAYSKPEIYQLLIDHSEGKYYHIVQ